MTTALMLQLFPGIERITGGGIAGGIDPSLRVGKKKRLFLHMSFYSSY